MGKEGYPWTSSCRREEELLRSRGVQVEVRQSAECIGLMGRFIEDSPRLWNEDIGV